jgi:hypothetical protein
VRLLSIKFREARNLHTKIIRATISNIVPMWIRVIVLKCEFLLKIKLIHIGDIDIRREIGMSLLARCPPIVSYVVISKIPLDGFININPMLKVKKDIDVLSAIFVNPYILYNSDDPYR